MVDRWRIIPQRHRYTALILALLASSFLFVFIQHNSLLQSHDENPSQIDKLRMEKYYSNQIQKEDQIKSPARQTLGKEKQEIDKSDDDTIEGKDEKKEDDSTPNDLDS